MQEEHKHYWLGQNRQHFPGQEVIFKLSFPRVFIRYELANAYPCDYEDFYKSIAEVQWIDGEKPSPEEQEEIFIDAWNFLALEERKMEEEEDEDWDDEFM